MTDIHDTEGTEPGAGTQPVAEPGGAEDLLEELIEIITSAKSMPLSSSAIVTRDEVLDLLEAIRDELPEELRRARRLLKDHEELLAAARREAADIVSDGEGPVRAHGPADRDRPPGRAPGGADRRGCRGRGAPDAPRGRGLRRPEARRLRDRPRPDAEDGARPAANGLPRCRRPSPSPATRHRASSATMPGSRVRGSSTRISSDQDAAEAGPSSSPWPCCASIQARGAGCRSPARSPIST